MQIIDSSRNNKYVKTILTILLTIIFLKKTSDKSEISPI